MKRESDSSGGALLLLARGCPGPWKELVEAIVRPEIDEADENIGKIGLGLDVVQFCRPLSATRRWPNFQHHHRDRQREHSTEATMASIGSPDLIRCSGAGASTISGFHPVAVDASRPSREQS